MALTDGCFIAVIWIYGWYRALQVKSVLNDKGNAATGNQPNAGK